MSDEFDEPTQEFTGVRINPRDCVGHLLMIWVVDYLAHKPTQFTRPDKPSDVIVVDVVDLDEADIETGAPGLLARHVWWRQAKLIQSLRPRVSSRKPMLAYMAKGGASTGFNAPFILNSATDEPAAVQRAKEWMARNPNFTPSTPMQGDEVMEEPPAPPMSQPSLVERMAAQAQRGAARLPNPPDKFPY